MKKMAAGESTSTGGTSTVTEFRAKVAHMKNWKPASTPSVSQETLTNGNHYLFIHPPISDIYSFLESRQTRALCTAQTGRII
jgi:hypothetical protein